MIVDPSFWDDQNKAQEISNKNNALKSVINDIYNLENQNEDLYTTIELLQEEYNEDMHKALESDLKTINKDIEQFELNLLLNGEHDENNAVVELHHGAGGTESQVWSAMLLRMYHGLAEHKRC